MRPCRGCLLLKCNMMKADRIRIRYGKTRQRDEDANLHLEGVHFSDSRVPTNKSIAEGHAAFPYGLLFVT